MHRPVAGAVDAAADHVAVLHGDEVDGVVPRAGDVAVLDVHVLALVHLQRLLRHGVGGDRAGAPDGGVAEEDVRAGLEMEHVAAAGRDVEALEDEVAAAEHVHRRPTGRAGPVGCPHDDRGGPRAEAVLPVVGHDRLGVGAGHEVDADTLRERDADGHLPPGLGERAHRLGPRRAPAAVVAERGIDPDLRERRRADVVGGQRRIRGGARGEREPGLEPLAGADNQRPTGAHGRDLLATPRGRV